MVCVYTEQCRHHAGQQGQAPLPINLVRPKPIRSVSDVAPPHDTPPVPVAQDAPTIQDVPVVQDTPTVPVATDTPPVPAAEQSPPSPPEVKRGTRRGSEGMGARFPPRRSRPSFQYSDSDMAPMSQPSAKGV